jgi:S-adenosylmethionine synthetase
MLSCAIGDNTIDGLPYKEIVKQAKDYIDSIGGFEEFAKWGLY